MERWEILASFARAPGPRPRPCPRKIILQKCATIPKRCPPSNQKLTCHPNILRSMFKLFRSFRVLLETLNFLTLSPDAAPKLCVFEGYQSTFASRASPSGRRCSPFVAVIYLYKRC